jgi:ABC-2 type transport system permease protein
MSERESSQRGRATTRAGLTAPAPAGKFETKTLSAVREIRIVFARAMRLSLRNPTWVIIGLTQPILYLVLFGPLLEPLAGQLGTGNAYQLFVPGMLVQLGIFGALFVGFGLVAEYRAGVIETQRVTPARRSSLLLGRVLRDVVVLLVQATVLTLVALPLGLRAPVGGVLLGIAVVGLLGAAFSAVSYAVALTLKSEDALAPLLNAVAIPVLLLSGILLPMSLAPGWLERVSDVNPLKHVVEGVRACFRGDFSSATAWWGLGLTVALVVVGMWFGTRTFRRESA